MSQQARILHTAFVTHDVRQFVVSRPDGFVFEPGQGVEVAVDEDGRRDEAHPFTPTSRRDGPALEFLIKKYPSHSGLTERLHQLAPGDRLLLGEPFGTLTDQGPGTFIAGGAGVTPFLAIFRHMEVEDLGRSSLVFSNHTPDDVICEKELLYRLGDRCHLTCTVRSAPGYDDRRIDQEYLRDTVDEVGQRFYVCGPPSFVEDVTSLLVEAGASRERIVLEE